MSYLTTALRFINILDRDGNLSLTNIAVITSLILAAIRPETSEATAALVITLMNYAHKRYYANQERVPETPADVVAMQAQINQLKSEHEAVHKLAEDTKKLLSQSNLTLAFQPRAKAKE